jgi:hypothetical protein
MKNPVTLAEDPPPDACYPPFGARYLRAIELAVRQAWAQLLDNPGEAAKLATANEVDISHQLRTALNGLRERRTGEVPGYTYDVFEHPQLGAEFQTQHGAIRKPDLVFFLAGRPRPGVADGMRDAIFVECKLLEKGKTVATYCQEGLKRFVTGDYGAWVREGMMLGYVRDKSALPEALIKLGQKETFRKSLSWDGNVSLCTLTELAPRVHLTVHQRNWLYQGQTGSPGPIEIRHLWLRTQT